MVAGLQLPKGLLSQQDKPFSHRGRAVTKTERDVVREWRERRALLSFVGWPVSFESFDVRHGGLVERGFFFLSLCHRVVFIVLREFSMR